MNTQDRLMPVGKLVFNQSSSFNTERHYKEIIYILEQKLIQDPKCVESLQGWIAGYHNLAVLYQTKGELELAQKCLVIPHHSMMYMAQNTKDDEELEVIANKAMNLTLPTLLEFAKAYPHVSMHERA